MNTAVNATYSGMRAQMEALDVISTNLANLNTAGFKGEKAFFTVLDNAMNSSPQSEGIPNNAMVQARSAIDMSAGSLQLTQRDLDIAIEGDGFIALDSDRGERFTRNGHLNINNKSELCVGNLPVMGEGGGAITVGPGRIVIDQNGDISVNNARVGRIKIVEFNDPSTLIREGNSLFADNGNTPTAKDSTSKVKQGYIEQSNVNAVSCVVNMVSLMRQYESMQKSFNILMNEIAPKAIEKLSR